MKHKKLFISLTTILTVVLALIIFLMIWFWGDSYKTTANYEGFESFRAEFEIPGLKDGACPQGMANYRTTYLVDTDELVDPENPDEGYVTEEKIQEYYFISAYFKDEPSRIYVVGKETGYVGYVTMRTPVAQYSTETEVYSGHCGGIATNGYTFWMVSGRMVYCAQRDGSSSDKNNIARDIIALAQSNGELTFTAAFNANLNAAFCFFYDEDGNSANRSSSDRFYIGEFYRPKDYETDKLHHLTTLNGDENRAFVHEYNISTSSTNKYGLTMINSDNVDAENYVPKVQAIYSITDEIQGLARTGKTGLVLSQSWGLSNSHLLYYDWERICKSENRKLYRELTYTVKDKEGEDKEVSYGGFPYEGVPTKGGAQYKDSGSLYVYYIDKTFLLNNYSIPSMSEGLCVTNNRVYVLFESGANKYKWFVRQKLTDVYSFIPRAKK